MRKSLMFCFAALIFCSITQAQTTGPVIIAKKIITGQTTAIPTTTLITPQKDGVFRISYVIETTLPHAEQTGAWCTAFGWTNDVGVQQPIPFSLCSDAWDTNPIDQTIVLKAKAGTPITYGVVDQGADGSTYALTIVIERLL